MNESSNARQKGKYDNSNKTLNKLDTAFPEKASEI